MLLLVVALMVFAVIVGGAAGDQLAALLARRDRRQAAELPAAPKPDLMAIAKLEHELWGDREHTSDEITAHCWTCHPSGTPESIHALTPETYWHYRDAIIDGATHDLVEGVRVERQGGAITNTPFTALHLPPDRPS